MYRPERDSQWCPVVVPGTGTLVNSSAGEFSLRTTPVREYRPESDDQSALIRGQLHYVRLAPDVRLPSRQTRRGEVDFLHLVLVANSDVARRA